MNPCVSRVCHMCVTCVYHVLRHLCEWWCGLCVNGQSMIVRSVDSAQTDTARTRPIPRMAPIPIPIPIPILIPSPSPSPNPILTVPTPATRTPQPNKRTHGVGRGDERAEGERLSEREPLLAALERVRREGAREVPREEKRG